MTFVDRADFGDLLRLAAGHARGDAETWERFVEGVAEPVRRRMAEEFFAWQAHGGQAEPPGSAGAGPGDWRVWLLRAGRGFGKTRAGAEWLWARVREHEQLGTVAGDCPLRIALVAASREEAARVMVEGPSGLLATARSDEAVRWVPTRGTLEFGSGALAFVYSAAAPDQLRGPEHHFAWCDELAKWKKGEATWDNLTMGLRLGARPRAIVTTTPRSCALLRRLRSLKGTVETVGRTAENIHLADEVRGWLADTYGGTRLGRQELDGELFDEVEGALFPRGVLEVSRQSGALPREGLKRVVVGVDPPASADGDACGIVVCGLGAEPSERSGPGILYVLADCSAAGLRPEGWARRVAAAAEAWQADRVVAEKNQGGDMVESVLRSVEARLPVRLVSASRGKAARAEPVASLFEAGKARLAGCFPELEDELAGMTAGGGYEPGSLASARAGGSGPGGPGRSPDRADAMVWAMTELMKPAPAPPRVRRL